MPKATSCAYRHAPMISSHDTQLDMDIIVSMFIQYRIQILQQHSLTWPHRAQIAVEMQKQER